MFITFVANKTWELSLEFYICSAYCKVYQLSMCECHIIKTNNYCVDTVMPKIGVIVFSKKGNSSL